MSALSGVAPPPLPNSPTMTGMFAVMGVTSRSKHAVSGHHVPSYEWSDATSWPSGSFGLYVHRLRDEFDQIVLAHWMPPSTITFCAPVERTASTSACIPTAWLPLMLVPTESESVESQLPPAPPSRQQDHERIAAASVPSLALLFGMGSLKRSKSTIGLFLKRFATDRQNSSEYDVFGIACCPVASCPAGALQCRSRSTYMPLAVSRLT